MLYLFLGYVPRKLRLNLLMMSLLFWNLGRDFHYKLIRLINRLYLRQNKIIKNKKKTKLILARFGHNISKLAISLIKVQFKRKNLLFIIIKSLVRFMFNHQALDNWLGIYSLKYQSLSEIVYHLILEFRLMKF